jgi:hypothetical protein
MKEVKASTFIEVLCTCPNCGYGLDIFDEVKDHMEEDHRASGIDVHVTCEDCNETFIVTDIEFYHLL